MVAKGILLDSTVGEAVEHGTVILLFRGVTNGTCGALSKDIVMDQFS